MTFFGLRQELSTRVYEHIFRWMYCNLTIHNLTIVFTSHVTLGLRAELTTRCPSLMALPTYGRVLLDTTAGDIDIELWSKVRNCDTMTPLTLE